MTLLSLFVTVSFEASCRYLPRHLLGSEPIGWTGITTAVAHGLSSYCITCPTRIFANSTLGDDRVSRWGSVPSDSVIYWVNHIWSSSTCMLIACSTLPLGRNVDPVSQAVPPCVSVDVGKNRMVARADMCTLRSWATESCAYEIARTCICIL